MARANTEFLICIPCDSPIFPDDLVEQLYYSLHSESADIVIVHDGNRRQPVFALIKTSLLGSLIEFLSNGQRKIDKWYANNLLVTAEFSNKEHVFLNINNNEDLISAELYISNR
jgi:molybdopterin-guanine dinucleotide biosynthesis protein A